MLWQPDGEWVMATITGWARTRNDIRGVALVGSHARGAARPDSDIDLVLLCEEPEVFRAPEWITEINCLRSQVVRLGWKDEEYGAVWSRRVQLLPQVEIEFSFARLSWGAVTPVDPGTRRVVAGGCRALYDPDGLVERLIRAAAEQSEGADLR
jgi:uncharacterized protein